jgi:tetratricopeptide (TPR) repeat protein
MSPQLILLLLVALVFSFSTWLQPRAAQWTSGRDSDQLMQVLLGDGRKILANHMFVQADVYFHSGYYPSVFDQQYSPTNSAHMTETGLESEPWQTNGQHDRAHEQEEEHEKAMSFLREPKDWIERFGRRFAITEHQHLTAGKEREILPFLKLSAELDPQRIDTYTVAAYWLSSTLGKPDQAEEFLREGLKANPRSFEILFELGRISNENRRDTARARNLWSAALDRWNEQEPQKEKPNLFALDQILVNLARLEEKQGNYAQAIHWLEMAIAKDASPSPDALRKQIDELKAKVPPK